MSRYDIPGPLCRHKPTGTFATCGKVDGFASVECCDRRKCVQDAALWCLAVAGRYGKYTPYPVVKP